MNRKAEYSAFLKSEFWVALSAQKKASVGGVCEQCGRTDRLQSHHIEYPRDWYKTTLDHLMVLCRWCHAKVHGKSVSQYRKFFLFRNDMDFSRIIWRVDGLTRRIGAGGYRLSPRDVRFLELVRAAYPPTHSDGCMDFHVQNCLDTNKLLNP